MTLPATAPQDLSLWWNFGDLTASRARFIEQRDRWQANDPGFAAEIETQIARVDGLEGKFADGHAKLDALLAAGNGLTARTRLRIALERGRLFNSGKERAKAMPCFEEAARIGRETGEEALTIDALHMLAIAADGAGAQEKWAKLGLEAAEKSSDPKARGWRGPLLNNLGWTYMEAKRPAEALVVFRQALAVREETPAKVTPIVIAKYAVAKALRDLARHEEALKILEDADAQAKAAGGPDDYVIEEIAENLVALGRKADAAERAKEARALLPAKGEEPRRERLSVIAGGK